MFLTIKKTEVENVEAGDRKDFVAIPEIVLSEAMYKLKDS